MPRFFVNEVNGEDHILDGENAQHIIKSLRMTKGETLILCDFQSIDHICNIEKIDDNKVYLKVLKSQPCFSEPQVKVTLYQALTKGDKMDFIIQKAVELGVYRVVPVLTNRCVSRPSESQVNKKVERWQKISKEAAKQSGRGIIPTVMPVKGLNDAVDDLINFDKSMVFFEGGGEKIDAILPQKPQNIAILVGPEGGFELEEMELLRSKGAKVATLGKRILRAETAPICALSIIMHLLDN